jgi:hypothetical protein
MTATRAALALLFLMLASQACGREPGVGKHGKTATASAEYCEARRVAGLGCGRCSVSSCEPAALAADWRHQGDTEKGRRHAGMDGEVGCDIDGHPVIEPPLSDSVTGITRAENVRHESAHGAQFAANCDSVLAIWKVDPAYRLALESEATCRGIAVYPDSERRIRKGQAAATLTRLYLPTFGYEDVTASLDQWCGDG